MGLRVLYLSMARAARVLVARNEPFGLPADVELPPPEKQPYAQHVDELTMADWWVIALKSCDLASVQFEVPGEDLVIVMQGRPDRYGPAVVEIRNREGKVLKRFEREQIEVKLVP